jgi:protein-S-isoprenylcysteine O-methyltransferase Ste14
MLGFVVILIAFASYGFIHSWLASLQAKALARRLLGPVSDRFYRLAYNIFAFVSLLPVFALLPLLPDRMLYSIPLPWSLLTLVVQGIAGLAALLAVLQTGAASFLGLRQLVQPEDASPTRLNISGLYRFVRHPIYTASIVFIWLTPVMTLNLLALYLAFTAYFIIGAMFEERKLVAEFGQAYLDYRRKVPFLIPFTNKFSSSENRPA